MTTKTSKTATKKSCSQMAFIEAVRGLAIAEKVHQESVLCKQISFQIAETGL